MKNLIYNILCLFNVHIYEITKLVDEKGRTITFDRTCQNCGKEQILKRPKEYHPGKYVWTDKK